MVYCIQARLGFATEEARNLAQVSAENKLTGTSKWQLVTVRAGKLWEHEFGLRLEVRYTRKNDRDGLAKHLEKFVTDKDIPPLAGSWIRIHDCPHEEGHGACAEPEIAREW